MPRDKSSTPDVVYSGNITSHDLDVNAAQHPHDLDVNAALIAAAQQFISARFSYMYWYQARYPYFAPFIFLNQLEKLISVMF